MPWFKCSSLGIICWHSVPLHLQSHPLRPAWVPATLRNPQLPSIVPFKANNSTQRGTRHGTNRRDRKCARQHHILVSPFPSRPVLTQCSEDDLSAAKSVAATNRGDRELVLRVGRQVLEDDGFTMRCHSSDDPVTWIRAWLLSSLPELQATTQNKLSRETYIQIRLIKGGGT